MNPLIRFIFRTHAQSTQREKKFHTKTRCAEALSNSVVIRNWQRSLLLYYLTSGMKYDQSEIGDQYKLIFERIDDLWNYTRNMQKKKKRGNKFIFMYGFSLITCSHKNAN